MVARLILEMDDESGPEFAKMIQRMEEAEQTTVQLNKTTTDANTAALKEYQTLQQEVARLREELHKTAAQRSQTVQVIAKENHLMAGALNSVGQATGAAAMAAVESKAEWIKWRLQVLALQKAAQVAATTLTGTAATAAAAAGPAIAAYAALVATYKTVNFVLENTDQRLEKVGRHQKQNVVYTERMTKAIAEQAGIVVHNNEQLIEQINATKDWEDAQKRLQKVMQATGKSAEELGVKAQSNAQEIKDAFSDLGDRLAEPFERSGQAIKAWWESSDLVRDALDKMEGGVDFFTETATWKIDLVSKGWDELRVQVGRVVGANADEYRKEIQNLRELEEAQERVAEAQERAKPHFEALKAANKALEEEAKLKEKLAHIDSLRSDQIDVEINKLQQWAGESAVAGEFLGKNQQEYTTLFKALTERRKEALKEEAESAKKAAEEAEKAEEKRLEAVKKRAQEEARLRQEAAKAEAEFREQRLRGTEELALQEQRHRREMEIDRLQRAEGNEQRITEILKEGLHERAELELEFAKSAADAERIKWELERDLRDLDHKHALEMAEKKAQAIQKELEEKKKAAQKEIGIENQKIEAIKALRDNQGKNLFEKFVGRQSQQEVLEEITRKRLEESRKENPEAQGARRRQMDARIRFQTRQQAMQGKLNPGEVQKAQADLASREILQLKQQGALNKETLTALAEQAKAHLEKARFDEEMANQLTEIREALREVQGTTRGRTQRLRAQRRSTRG